VQPKSSCQQKDQTSQRLAEPIETTSPNMHIDELATPLSNLNILGAKSNSGVSLRKFINNGHSRRKSIANGTIITKMKDLTNNSAFVESIRLH
jgi:hypothetical protein